MLSRRTLLLADDSPTVQKVISLTFADEGMQVLTTSGGEEALARLGEAVPDVLLADVHMPKPDGYELCARVKRDPRTSHVPVLLLVGTFEPFDEAEARRAGADGVLTKPFQSIRELVSKVGGLIGGNTEQNRAAASARAAELAARAGADDATAAAQEAPPPAEPEDLQPSPVFAGLADDDESIESVPADGYVAAGRARREEAAEFVAAHAPFAQGAVGGARGVEAAAGVVEASSFGAAAGGRAPGGYAAARFSAPQSESVFAPRPPQPPSDDSLLELGEAVSARARDAADSDDLILDIGDDADADGAQAEAPDSADLFSVVDVEDETAGEPHGAAEISPANLSSAWSDAPSIEVPPARAPFTEPVIDEAPVPANVEHKFEAEAEAGVGADSPATPAPAETVETHDAHSAAGAATTTDAAPPAAADSRAQAAESQAAAPQLSPEMVDAVARRVVELMSDRSVREIAWEVVPDLAERLIRERLEQENTRS